MGIEVIISDENGLSIDRHETAAKLMRLEYYLNRVSKRQKQLKKEDFSVRYGYTLVLILLFVLFVGAFQTIIDIF